MAEIVERASDIIADRPLGPPALLPDLHRRQRRRTARWAAVASVAILFVTFASFAALHDGSDRRPLHVTSQTPTTLPGPPSGRFVATYVPAGLVQVGEKELAKVAVGLPNPGRFRSWTAPPTGSQPVHLNASWISDAPTLDVDAEVARYVGARRVEIQGRPALFLPQLSARPAPVLAWQPLPGQMVTVSGTAVADNDVLATAQALKVPELEASSLPAGFNPVPQSSEMAQPVPVPRRYSLYYGVGGSPDAATALSPQPTGPALSIPPGGGSPWPPLRPPSGRSGATRRWRRRRDRTRPAPWPWHGSSGAISRCR